MLEGFVWFRLRFRFGLRWFVSRFGRRCGTVQGHSRLLALVGHGLGGPSGVWCEPGNALERIQPTVRFVCYCVD